MLGIIEKIQKNCAYVKLFVDPKKTQNLLNLFVLINDNGKNYIGQIDDIDNGIATVILVGEYTHTFTYGIINKPSLSSKVDLISTDFIQKLLSNSSKNKINVGYSPFYKDVKIDINPNDFFSSHFAIFGTTGSGKSCSFARIIQNLMSNDNITDKMNLIIFDAYGEYYNSFEYLNKTNKYSFKSLTTNKDSKEEIISLPVWFLDIDDYVLLLNATTKNQVSIIEKALRNVNIFKQNVKEVVLYKNNIIASALLDILLSGRPAAQIRDQMLSALSRFYTNDLNLESKIVQPGYIRTFRQCLLIDDNNKMPSIEIVADFLRTFLSNKTITSLPNGTYSYSLQDFSDGLDFALIDEGIWKSEKVYDEANVLRIRLNSLLSSNYSKYFEYSKFITVEDYIKELFTDKMNGKKIQILNFNISYIDDRFAKNIVKLYSKFFFNYAKSLPEKASNPFNIILEEAHRYVQKDSDENILGYNIFERITKEGRKYGVLLGLISQRPCELSETCLSQCSNFLLFKTNHPFDLDYVERVIPAITEEIVDNIKILKPGYSISFGTAFKMPTIVKFDMPNPAPNSDNCKIESLWFEDKNNY